MVRRSSEEPLAAACFIGLRPIVREYTHHGLEAHATVKAKRASLSHPNSSACTCFTAAAM
jgi:hypothetical protein